jgi:hypothetical protein
MRVVFCTKLNFLSALLECAQRALDMTLRSAAKAPHFVDRRLERQFLVFRQALNVAGYQELFDLSKIICASLSGGRFQRLENELYFAIAQRLAAMLQEKAEPADQGLWVSLLRFVEREPGE